MSELRIRGIVEGFYGRPWSWPDRHRAVDLLGQQGGNTYLYAPKNDPLHRDRWREPYLPEEWDRFAELNRAAADVGVDFWFGISPLGVRVSDERDVAKLTAKLHAADDAGVRRFCLLMDDMPDAFAATEDADRFSTVAAAHVHLVEHVRSVVGSRGADRELWFVPLHYHGDPDQPYVREIGAGIDPSVAILWTGPEVCSETLTRAHTEAVATSLRRKVLYWDNHPVNDGGMRHDPHLGPLRGRDAELGTAAAGILSNVGIQPEASLIAVATFCDYARDPHGYDPEQAWSRALRAVTSDAVDAEAVAVLADLSPRSPLWRRPALHNALAGPLARFEAAWDGVPDDRRAELETIDGVLSELGGVAARLNHGLCNVRLRADLSPWSRKLGLQVAAARLALGILAATLEGPTGPVLARRRQQVHELLHLARSDPSWVAGDQLEVFARGCLRRADALLIAGTSEAEREGVVL